MIIHRMTEQKILGEQKLLTTVVPLVNIKRQAFRIAQHQPGNFPTFDREFDSVCSQSLNHRDLKKGAVHNRNRLS